MNKIETTTCPYNSSHIIEKFKLIPHVHRCKDQLKFNKKLFHCKKNSMIMFFEDKKQAHLKECEYCYNISTNNMDRNLDDISFTIKKKLKNSIGDSISMIDSNILDNSNLLNSNELNVSDLLSVSNFSMMNDSNNVNNDNYITKNIKALNDDSDYSRKI